MQIEVEKEFKYLVTPGQFKTLLSKCNSKYHFIDEKLQLNYYYDTKDNALNRARTTVRIRQQNENLKLQIKKHNNDGNLTKSDEYSINVEALPYYLRIPNINDSLFLKGVLITERKGFSFLRNSIIYFDINTYLGMIDYEIEIEIDEEDKNEVLRVIKHLKLEHATIKSKSERLFERLEKIMTLSY